MKILLPVDGEVAELKLKRTQEKRKAARRRAAISAPSRLTVSTRPAPLSLSL
jgi:hypothetical protein